MAAFLQNLFNGITDNIWVRIAFAAWTGYYLWQIIVGEEGSQYVDFAWMAIGFMVAMIVLGPKITQGT